MALQECGELKLNLKLLTFKRLFDIVILERKAFPSRVREAEVGKSRFTASLKVAVANCRARTQSLRFCDSSASNLESNFLKGEGNDGENNGPFPRRRNGGQ